MRTVPLCSRLWLIRMTPRAGGQWSHSPLISTWLTSCPSTRSPSLSTHPRWSRSWWRTRWQSTAVWPTWPSACHGTSARPPAPAWEPPATDGSMMDVVSVWEVSVSTMALIRAGLLSVCYIQGVPKMVRCCNCNDISIAQSFGTLFTNTYNLNMYHFNTI